MDASVSPSVKGGQGHKAVTFKGPEDGNRLGARRRSPGSCCLIHRRPKCGPVGVDAARGRCWAPVRTGPVAP